MCSLCLSCAQQGMELPQGRLWVPPVPSRHTKPQPSSREDTATATLTNYTLIHPFLLSSQAFLVLKNGVFWFTWRTSPSTHLHLPHLPVPAGVRPHEFRTLTEFSTFQARKGADGTRSSDPSRDPLCMKSVFLPGCLLTPSLPAAKDTGAGL